MWSDSFLSIKNVIKQEKFHHHYQPIINLANQVVEGFEGLLRSEEFSPDEIFLHAQKKKQLYKLDSSSIEKAVKSYNAAGFFKNEGKLFLNVFPSTLLSSNFPSFIKNIMVSEGLNSEQIVLEINEGERINSFTNIKNVVVDLKQQGFLIAIDDFGKGPHDLKIIIELKPDYIKIDQYFTKDLQQATEKQEVITFLVNFCKKHHIKLILEGLEREEDIHIAGALGVAYGQGFGLSKPKKIDEIATTIEQNYIFNRRKYHRVKFLEETRVTFLSFSDPKLKVLKNKNMKVDILDISISGMRILTSLNIPLKGTIRVEIEFTYKNVPYCIEGTVVRKGVKEASGLVSYGIEFTSTTVEQQMKLQQLVNAMDLKNSQ